MNKSHIHCGEIYKGEALDASLLPLASLSPCGRLSEP